MLDFKNNTESMMNLATFKIKHGALDNAEDLVQNVLQEDDSYKLVQGLVLWEKGDQKSSNILFYNLSKEDNQNVFLSLWLGVLYKKNGNNKLSLKYFAIAKRLKLKQLNLLVSKDENVIKGDLLKDRNVKPSELANQHGNPDSNLYDGIKKSEKTSLNDDDFDEIV